MRQLGIEGNREEPAGCRRPVWECAAAEDRPRHSSEMHVALQRSKPSSTITFWPLFPSRSTRGTSTTCCRRSIWLSWRIRVQSPPWMIRLCSINEFHAETQASSRRSADFLDTGDRTHRHILLTKKRQRLVELLKEKRTALITEAVTKGLDPSVEMKPGSRWLGDVPAHWDLLPLKRLVSKIGSGKTPRGGASVYLAEGVTFLRSQNVHFGGLRLQDVVLISREVDNEMRSTRVRPGDVLLNITGASLGRCCVAAKAATPANVNQHVCILRPLTSTDSLWLSIALESRPLQSQIWASQGGAAREGLNGYMTGSLVVPVPPTEEQQRIGVELGRALESLDRATNALERQTALIVEHRRALISAAVTGQIDIAAQPSEPEAAIA